MDISIIFPNQIFEKSKLLDESTKIYLIEEYLFFNQFKFHKQKILFHRMTMKSYERFLQKNSFDIKYIDSTENEFWETINKHRSPHIWKKEDGEWKLRHTVSNNGLSE